MNKPQFQHAMHRGFGRAILYAQSHDVRAFRDVILDACLRCYSHDCQFEGTRASYMYDLVDCLPDKGFYHREVLRSLAGAADDWDAAQRFHFATCLALDGSDDAKRAMYDNYNPGPTLGDRIGIDFAKIDGIHGLLFVAEKIGALLMVKPDAVDLCFLISECLEICDEQATWEALRDAGAANPSIECFRLAAERSHNTPVQLAEVQSLRFEQLNDLLAENSSSLRMWGASASDAELKLAAEALLDATTSEQQLAHLKIFGRRSFPLDVQPLVNLVSVEHDRVRVAAARALTNMSHPLVREMAFRLIESHADGRDFSIDLLVRNYQEGDHAIVLRWLQQEQDGEVLHSLGMGALRFWDSHPDEHTAVSMLRLLYERGPCSFCRESAVRRLLDRSALPDDFQQECAWDANTDIRDIVGQRQ